ncbi:hypothetical protein IQ249_22250 [Lusitaniella coriacea LEGE 07157]|uniref:Uncharacterized protein n=1 Tax=Lusitaniella coriacea LEGE 07157 TaxID=945747 RepID=A0A8J7JE27_9CYAN|nr:hypothetical protein [Lusitaniella coriacea]MBE9118615.1 hypothetical protein [Lusitaniella coriacea LEGE 07157]
MKNILSIVLLTGSSILLLSSMTAANSVIFEDRSNIEFKIAKQTNLRFKQQQEPSIPKRKRPGGSR